MGYFNKKQTHEQVFINLMNTKKWFEIEDYYRQHKDSLSVIATNMFIAITGNAFNRPIEALDAYDQLINMIDSNQITINEVAFIIFITNPAVQLCFDAQEHKKGEELCLRFINYFQRDTIIEPDRRLEHIQQLTRHHESFKYLQKEQKLEVIKKRGSNKGGEIKLLPDLFGNGIIFNAKWNGINLHTFFDTGVGNGGYIYNRAIAEMIGLELNTADTVLINGKLRCLQGIVDSLELGEFFIKNIPVTVHIDTINPTDSNQVICDSLLNLNYDIILGLPVIRQLGVVELDFVKNAMSFPPATTTFSKRNLYIENSGLFMNIEVCNHNFLTFFDTGGAQCLAINTDFYEKNKQHISIDTLERFEVSKIAGCVEESTNYQYYYGCPQIDIKVNDLPITLINDCSVAKDKENNHILGTPEGGYLGNMIFKYCQKATFDFDNMIFSMQGKPAIANKGID